MTWGEAIRLARLLRADPGSHIAAALEGWEHPFPREQAMAADLWDLQYMKASPKKPAKYPRPWPEVGKKLRRGDAAGRTPEQVKALLATQFGRPQPPV